MTTADSQIYNRRLKIAVVGTGGWGRQHARVFRERRDTDLCAIVGRTAETTEARARQYQTKAYLDIDEMLEQESPDLVSVCLPNESHFEATLHLLERATPLLVEKPLVFELDEADQLLDAASNKGVFFAINFNHRYAKPVIRAKELIDSGALGELVVVTWRFGGEPNFGTHPHANLIETQCHGFDMLEHLSGPITSVMAQMTNRTHGFYSSLVVALEFETGGIGSLVGTYDSSYSFPQAHRVEWNGTAGRAIIEDTVQKLTVSYIGHETSEVWEPGYFNDLDRSFHNTFDVHVDAVLQAFRSGDDPPVHARYGRRALQLAYACIESFESGERVSTVP